MVIGAALLVGAFLVAVGEYVRATWSAEAQDLRRELNNVQGMTRSLRADIDFVAQNTDRYQQTLARGLFGDRDRLLARRALEHRVSANRLQGSITLQPRVTGEAHRVGRDQYTILRAPVLIAAEGMLDADLFALLDDLDRAVPGYLIFSDGVLSRVGAVTDEELTMLRNGLPVPLVTGRLTFQWLSAGPVGTEETTQ